MKRFLMAIVTMATLAALIGSSGCVPAGQARVNTAPVYTQAQRDAIRGLVESMGESWTPETITVSHWEIDVKEGTAKLHKKTYRVVR